MTAPEQSLARTLTVLNLKGGVGMTHTSWLLASVCQEQSQRILLIDTDAQANLTNSFLPQREGLPGVEALFDPAAEIEPQALVRPTAYSQIDILPASPALARVDVSDPEQWERADLHLSLVEAVKPLRAHYHYIVFDCPPRLSVVSIAALCASDAVIIPLEAADWGAQGIVQVATAIEHVQQRYNQRLRLLGYLVSRFKRARVYQLSYLAQLRKHYGSLAFDTLVCDLAAFEKSVTDRIPITLHAPRSAAAGIARRLFDEVEQRLAALERSGFSSRRANLQSEPVAVSER